jgi:hypothetical protein
MTIDKPKLVRMSSPPGTKGTHEVLRRLLHNDSIAFGATYTGGYGKREDRSE